MKENLKNRFDGLIFDLDGTLWDSTISVAKAWQAAKEEVDYVNINITPEMVAGIAGMTYDAIYDTLFPELDSLRREEFKILCAKKELEELDKNGGVLYPHLEETLKYLSNTYKLFVVSNCQSGYIEIFLKYSKLSQYFTGHACYGTKSQPKAENIKDVVKDYGLKAPVYVGDTKGDYESSKKAGVPFIFAAYGFGNVEGDIAATILNFADLKMLL
ncbi:HAD family hydrolase [Arcticibacter tournemirensis]|uniref:phosphoglycolate phosphatase n=1 Tax=Arcticibacter tournemirensis TaxID=699437 RepID=A0A4Q0MA24_9SPHI|nr:HAD family hydrolase [Arcticibacter tournemirensis]RXF69649.1 HAD family hydrolase [Arcticibacter tournemirensis]